MSSDPVHAEPVTPKAPPTSEICKSEVVPFGDGFKISLFSPNIHVELLSVGASINSVKVRDPHKKAEDPEAWVETCLGYVDFDESKQSVCRGAVRGRYAGLIGNAEFDLHGSNYKLLQNEGANCLHGGPIGFDKAQWKFIMNEGEDEIGVSFHLTSPHLDQGFPGEVFVTATYSILKNACSLKYSLQATLSDSTVANSTVINLANGTYWNLNGVPRPSKAGEKAPLPPSIRNHLLQMNANYFAEVDEENLPTGNMIETKGTVNDYTVMRPIEEGMLYTKEQGREPWGYNDTMALETWDSTLREAAILYSPKTKLQMKVSTTNPTIHVFTGNKLPADADGSPNSRFQQHSGICLNCQYFPNSPNIESFPTTTLNRGETYLETTTHEFQFLSAEPQIKKN